VLGRFAIGSAAIGALPSTQVGTVVAGTAGQKMPLRRASLLIFTILATAPTMGQDKAIGPQRCELNKAAGPITFLTSYGYAASAGILDILAAKQQGYFDALCLDVTMQPGSNNIQLVSAGTAQFAGVGGPSDTLVGIDNGADIVGIATYGNTGVIELLTMPGGSIKSLADFAGKTVGYKGAVPPQIRAMFIDAGVDETAINWVSVGYDPSILPDGVVDGLAAYKTNEPLELAARGLDVVAWDPADHGVASSFNTQIVNATWAKKHPTAVEDFLRASFKGLAWLNESPANLDAGLAYAAALSEAGYDVDKSKLRWQAEAKLVGDNSPKGHGFGWQLPELWQAEADMLKRFGLVKGPPDVARALDNSYIDAIYDGETLIWPAP